MGKYLALLCCFWMGNAIAYSISCPSLTEIQRVNGEYAWQTRNSLFEGYFAAPTFGRGQSSQVTQFMEVRWIQLTNLAEPRGLIECDYAGNIPGEVIRFVLLNAQVGPKPDSQNWSCGFIPPFPSSQCTCSSDTTMCIFETS